jgi:MFS family permease
LVHFPRGRVALAHSALHCPESVLSTCRFFFYVFFRRQADSHTAIISLFKPKRAGNADPSAPPTAIQAAKELRFDLRLARASLALDVVSHTMVVLAPSSDQAMFVAFSVISSFASGGLPVCQSLALGLVASSPDEGVRASGAGAVFGALAAVQAVGQMILGPLAFGALYAQTVGTWPKAIFAFAAATVFVALALMSALQAPRAPRSRRKARVYGDEQFRGRSRTPKDLRPRGSFGSESSVSNASGFGESSSASASASASGSGSGNGGRAAGREMV